MLDKIIGTQLGKDASADVAIGNQFDTLRRRSNRYERDPWVLLLKPFGKRVANGNSQAFAVKLADVSNRGLTPSDHHERADCIRACVLRGIKPKIADTQGSDQSRLDLPPAD